MPSIHIPERDFDRLVEQEGGYKEAKEAVKAAVKTRVSEE